MIMNFIKNIFIKLFAQKTLYYINGPETLPEPLTAEEEAELLSDTNEQAN